MTSRKARPTSRREEMLELWMGEPADAPPMRRRPPGRLVVAAAGLGILGAVGLAKYAADVLLIVVALGSLGVGIHFLGTWLAESDLLSPGWFTILVLAAALGGFALFYPTDGLEGLRRYVPKPVAKFFEWSESKGWGQRVLIQPSAGGSASASGATQAPQGGRSGATSAAAASKPVAVPSPTVVLTASANRVSAGQGVVLTARIFTERAPSGFVRFFDGLRVLGDARIFRSGTTWLASASYTLPNGRHEITASWQSGLLTGSRSRPVTIIVD